MVHLLTNEHFAALGGGPATGAAFYLLALGKFFWVRGVQD
jgi:hypothetical protein